MSQTEEDILKSLGIGLPQVPTEESILNSMGVGLPRHPELQPAKTTIPQIAWETTKEILRSQWKKNIEWPKKKLEEITGTAEALGAGATGLAAFPVNVATRIGLRPFVGPEKAEEIAGKVGEVIQYQPTTEAGKEYAGITALPFEILAKATDFIAQKMAPEEGTQREIKLALDTAILLSPLLKNYITNAIKSGKPISVEETAKIVEASKEIPIEQKAEFVATMKKAKTKRVLPKPEQAYEPTKRMPPTKTEQEAMLEQAEKLGTYPIRGFMEEPKTPIIKKGYPKEYIEKQNKILAEQEKVINAEADILKRTGKTEPEINAFLKNDFMDGEKLRETTNKVLAGELKPEAAAKDIGEWIDATVGKVVTEWTPEAIKKVVTTLPRKEAWELFKKEGITDMEVAQALPGLEIRHRERLGGQVITPEEVTKLRKVQPIEKVGIPKEVPTVEKPQGKIEAGGLAYGMELPEKAININLNRIFDDYGIKKLLVDTADKNKILINEQRRGVITNTQTQKLAEELGMTVEKLMGTKKGKAMNAEEALAARQILMSSAKDTLKYHEEFIKTGSDEALANFRIRLERHARIQKVVSGITAEAGRALQQFRITTEPGQLRFKALDKILKQLGGREKNAEIAEKMAMLDMSDPVAVNKFMRDISNPKLVDKIFEVWVNGLLLNIPTQAANIDGNFFTLIGKPIETLGAATIEAPKRIWGKVRGKTIEPEHYFGESAHQIFGIIQGIPEGVRRALFAWNNEMTMEGATKLEVRTPTAIKGKGGKIVRIPGRALQAADEFFKAIIYESDTHGLAYREATARGLRGQERINKIAELIEEPTLPMMNHAKGEMLYRTFQQELGKAGKAVQRIRQEIPFVRYIVPFVRTPINLIKYGLERTPINLPRIIYKQIKGQIPKGEISMEYSKVAIGGLTSMAVFLMALKGKVTGGGPTDKSQREAMYREGWQPYSFKIGKKYISYARIEPFATVFGISADAAEIWKDISEKDREDIAGKLWSAFYKNVTNKTFLTGISAATNAIADPEKYGGKWAERLIGSAIPTGVAQTARAVDPYFRDAKGLVDTLKARIPGVAQTLPIRVDRWGRPVERTGGVVEKMVSPIYRSEEKLNEVDTELKRLGLYPSMPARTFSVGKKKINLTGEEYEEFLRFRGPKEFNLLNSIMNSDKYKKMGDDEKKDRIQSILLNSSTAARIVFLPKILKNHLEELRKND
jgi:hypothetical protein